MKEFVLVTSKTIPDSFNSNNLHESGRMDIVCRCVINAVFVSESIRKDTAIHIAINNFTKSPRIISFYGNKLKDLYLNEKLIAQHIKAALKKSKKMKMDQRFEYLPGIEISAKRFETFIDEKNKTAQIMNFDKSGKDIDSFHLNEDCVFILSDYKKLPIETGKFLDNLKVEKVSVGKIEYLSSQVINIVHHVLDRRGFG